MRILVISDHADPLAEIGSKEAGGQNIFVYYLIKSLARLGIHSDVFTRWDRPNKKEIVRINHKIRIIRVKAGPKKYMPRDNFISVIKEFSENIFGRIQKEKTAYDVIFANYWFSGIAALKLTRKNNLPVIYIFHSIGKIRFKALKQFKFQSGNYDFFRKRIEKEMEIAQKADSIVSTSPIEKEILKKSFNISGEKIEYIPIGIDSNIFYPVDQAKARRRIGFEDKAKLILYVGRIEWRKGLGTLLYAFKEILEKFPRSKLLIVGGGKSRPAKKLEGAEMERLENIARELEIESKVFFLGAKNQKELFKYYSAADICVVPSYYEPFGIVPLESMACGTPVVASKTGGLKFTIKDGKTGFLAKPRNYQDLAEKIFQTLKLGKKHFCQNCLQRVNENFLWNNIARQYAEFFNQFKNYENRANSSLGGKIAAGQIRRNRAGGA